MKLHMGLSPAQATPLARTLLCGERRGLCGALAVALLRRRSSTSQHTCKCRAHIVHIVFRNEEQFWWVSLRADSAESSLQIHLPQ